MELNKMISIYAVLEQPIMIVLFHVDVPDQQAVELVEVELI